MEKRREWVSEIKRKEGGKEGGKVVYQMIHLWRWHTNKPSLSLFPLMFLPFLLFKWWWLEARNNCKYIGWSTRRLGFVCVLLLSSWQEGESKDLEGDKWVVKTNDQWRVNRKEREKNKEEHRRVMFVTDVTFQSSSSTIHSSRCIK